MLVDYRESRDVSSLELFSAVQDGKKVKMEQMVSVK
jgi:hypothetical protein